MCAVLTVLYPNRLYHTFFVPTDPDIRYDDYQSINQKTKCWCLLNLFTSPSPEKNIMGAQKELRRSQRSQIPTAEFSGGLFFELTITETLMDVHLMVKNKTQLYQRSLKIISDVT